MKAVFTVTAVMVILLAQAQGTFSLIEINPLHGNSPLTATTDSAKTYYGAGELTGFTELNGKLYFSAQGSPGDDELWVTDGTQSGTSLVKAINPGHGANLGNLVALGNHILFMATDNDSTWDLWSSDGTGAGTLKIDTLNQWTNTALGPDNISTLGSRLLFCTRQQLLITDGTVGGTDSLLSITNYSQGFGYCDQDGQSYFILPEISGGNDVWRTNGTDTGTQTVVELDTTSFNITNAKAMQAFNGKIYLTATQAGQSPDLFSFDGNTNGQLKRIVIAPSGNSSPHGFNLYNGAFYFIANNGTSANIYRVSNTDSIPQPLIQNANFTNLSNLTFANNTAYCTGPNNKQVYAVELTSLTYSVLNLNDYTLPDFVDTDNVFLVGLNNQVFFEAYDSITGKQVLLQSDFTDTGTSAIMPAGTNVAHPFNSRLANGIQDVFDLKTWGNNLLVPANFNDAGRELWIFNPTTVNAISAIKQEGAFSIYPNPANNELIVKAMPVSGEVQQLNIENVTGQLILQQTLSTEISTVNLSTLAAGAYFVTLSQNGKTAGCQKLLVVK